MVWQLEGDGVAMAHTEGGQRARDLVGLARQLGPGQLAHVTVGADLNHRPLGRTLAGVPVEIVEDHHAGRTAGTAPATAAGMPRAFM